MATTLWSEVTVESAAPKLVSTCELTSQSRNGSTQTYTITIKMHTTSQYGWRNNRWACKVSIGGTVIAKNLTIKSKTEGVIGTKVYSASCTGSITVSGDTGSTTVTVEYWDTNYSTSLSGEKMLTKSATLSYDPLPVVSLGIDSYNHNSATLNYTYTNIAPTEVQVYANDVLKTTVTATPFTVTGLSPKTTYTFKGYGYANGAYGSTGTSCSLTTYPTPVTVSSANVSGIQPFQATVSITSSSTTDTDRIEYAVVNSAGTVVDSVTSTTPAYSWTSTKLAEETQYRFRMRARTKTSGVWSSYYYSSYFTTPADQASIYIKHETGVWKKGKAYMKINGAWVPAKKFYIKASGSWKQGINT